MEALSQVEKRLPASQNVFKNLSYLSPRSILSQMERAQFLSLPMQHIMKDIGLVEDQYRKIIHVDWASEDVFSGEIPSDAVQFWAGIMKHKISNGEQPFRQLAVYALTCLATPISNAVCERIFSNVTCVKTKLRNRIENAMLDSIVRIRTTLKFGGKISKPLKICWSSLPQPTCMEQRNRYKAHQMTLSFLNICS